ncbi:MAG TPA: hypothetical protein VHL57_13010 [Flavobacteriales bacterium]|nr:hypothetical protein [Flavobacteriales bacterium]
MTSTAVLENISADVRLLCYKAGAVVDAQAIAENIVAGRVLPDTRALIVYVPEDASFAMDMLETDHTERLGFASGPEFLAMVVEDVVFRQASALYFAYHPPKYRYQVFDSMHPAHAWVDKMLLEAQPVQPGPSRGEGA